MIRRRTITSYVWNSVSGNKMVILSNCIRNFFRKFELLGNSTQGENPAPDNPQETKSAGRKSKNLFNIADLRVGQVQKDGTINEKQIYYRTVILDVPQDGKYRITFAENNDYNMLYFAEMYTNGVYSQPYVRVRAGNPNHYITLVKGKNILSFSTHAASGSIDFTTDHNIMIAEESETLDYESYGYFFDLKITGKNLLSNKPTDWMIGKTTSWGAVPQTPVSYGKNVKNAIATINVKSSTNYSFINKETNKLWVCRIIELDANGLGLVNHALYANESFNYKKSNFSTRSNTANIVFEIKKVDNTELLSTDIESNKIMPVEGEVNEPTPYEPYAEQFMQIVLNEPLRGIGEYKDMLTKDGVVRKIYPPYEINLNDLRDGGYSRTNTVMFSVKVQNKTVGYASLKPSILCNILPDCALQMSNIYNNDKECIAVGGGIVLFRVNKSRLKDISSFEATKQSFIELMEGKKMLVEYALETSVTEPLPESVQAQLSSLHSENGTTHINIDSGEVEAGINIEYKCKS